MFSKASYSISAILLLLSVLSATVGLPTLNPEPPWWFVLSVIFAAAAVVSAPAGMSRRITGVFLALAVITLSWAYSRYIHDRTWMKELVFYDAGKHALYKKMITYCEEHPDQPLTNLSGFIRVGALNPADTNFLRDCRIVIHPYEIGESHKVFFEIWHPQWGGRTGVVHMVVTQNGADGPPQ